MTEEPVILSISDTGGRYYLLPLYDMWTDAFAVPGSRTLGTGGGHFALVSLGWQGTLPAEATRITAPTPYVWMIGRAQTNGFRDYAAVHKVQDGYTVTRLSCWRKEALPDSVNVDPSLDMTTPPLDQVNALSVGDYFAYAAELMKLHPPHLSDWSLLEHMKRIGLQQGKSFVF